MRFFCSALFITFGLCAIDEPSLADEIASAMETTVSTKARPIERKAPRYPSLPLHRGQEGWVVVSYVVQSDGTVAEPFVVESSGIDEFEESALKTVIGWTYEPATQNGQAVQQCETQTQLTFAIETQKRGVRKKFLRKYNKIKALLESGEIDEADALLDDTMAMGEWNLYEYSRLWLLDSFVAQARGDREAQLKALRRTIGKKGDFVDKSLVKAILPMMLQLELSLAQYSDAIQTYEEMTKNSTIPDDYRPLVDAIKELLTVIDSDQVLLSPAKLSACDDCQGRWTYDPLRRKFEFNNIVGKLDELELRCDWRLFRSVVSEGNSWNIPDSWGKCQLNVYGAPGTTFDFLEFPDSTEAAPTAAASAVQTQRGSRP